MKRSSIIVDFHHIRCDCCKVALHDELATMCPVCGARFDAILSNHVGLANLLARRRATARVFTPARNDFGVTKPPVQIGV